MATIKTYNAPNQTAGGLGQTKSTSGEKKKIESRKLVSPVAYSRLTRSLNRTHKPLDKKMGNRSMK